MNVWLKIFDTLSYEFLIYIINIAKKREYRVVMFDLLRFERVVGGRSRSAPFSLEFHLEFVPWRKWNARVSVARQNKTTWKCTASTMGYGQFTMTNGSTSKTEDKHRTDQNYFNIPYVPRIKLTFLIFLLLD